jgi:hypothetical protein
MLVVEIYGSARRHGVTDSDIEHAIDRAVVVAEDDEDQGCCTSDPTEPEISSKS